MHRYLILLALFLFSTSVNALCTFEGFGANGPFFWNARITIENDLGVSLTNYQVEVDLQGTTPLNNASISGFGQNTIVISGSDPFIIDITRQANDPFEPGESFVLVIQGNPQQPDDPDETVLTSLGGTFCGAAMADPSLTIIKDVINNNGGTADPDDFLLTVDGNSVLSGISNTYPANTPLVINETQLSGYSLTGISGDTACPAVLGGTVTLADGDDLTCTITNDDEPPTLLAVKTTSTGPDFAGNTASYTITVSNSSGVDAQDVVITDTPENGGFTYASSTVNLNGGATRPNVFDPNIGDNVMSWSTFTIPNGGSVEIDVTVDVASNVAAGVYDNSVNLTTSNNGAVINNYNGAASANTAEDVIIHQLSPLAGNLVINEVLYRATGGGAAGNDEFIELFNAGSTAINLAGLMLIDGNLVTGDLDGTVGSITGNTMSFDFSCADPDQICSGPTILQPGEYAVIWVGTQDLTTRDATGAVFQAWLGQTQKLANAADDVWLFGPNNEFIDYVAWGSSASNSVDTDYPPSVWDPAVQASLDGVPAGTSISLTPNGVDGDDSNCWEETLSADANGRCPAYLPTVDTDDSLPNRITSVGANNNGIASLIVEKVIVSDNGGTATLDDFDVSVNGTEVVWTDPNSTTGGSEEVATSAGTYILSEGSVAGYSNGTWSCTGGTFTAPDQIQVAPDEDVVCTITNDDIGTDLEIVKTVSNQNPEIGERITFSLEVTNNGPDDASNVVVDDLVLAGFSFVTGTMTGGDTRNQAPPNLQWIINSLPNGTSVTLEYQVDVN